MVTTEQELARLQCAAITNGCMSFLAFPLSVSTGAFDLPTAVNRDHRALELLSLNGWHVDPGRWVCGLHERGPCTCHPESAAGRSGGTCSGASWCEHCA